MGNDFDWLHSPTVLGALVVVALALPCFIIWELGERRPAIDVRLFTHRNYAIATICSMVGFLVIQGLLSLFIVQMQMLLGYSSALAGGVYLWMLLLSVPSAAIVHEMCKQIDVRLICSMNFLGFAATLTWFGMFDKTASFYQIAWPMAFLASRSPCSSRRWRTFAMFGLQGAQLIRAAEEFALLRTVAGGFGIALQGVVLFRRTPQHVLNLSDQFDGRRFAELDQLAHSPIGFKLRASLRPWPVVKSGAFCHRRRCWRQRRLSARRGRVRRPRRLRLAGPRHPSLASDRGGRAEATHSRGADGTAMTSRRLSVAPAAGLLFLLGGCAETSPNGERAQFLEPPAMSRTLARSGAPVASPTEASWPSGEWSTLASAVPNSTASSRRRWLKIKA